MNYCGLSLSLSTSKLLVGVFYNPPGSNAANLTQLRSSIVSIHNSLPIILCGDFNLPSLNWSELGPSSSLESNQSTLFCDLINDFSLDQLVLEPTRGNNVLDLLLTDHPEYIRKVEVTDGISGSDHDSVQFSINLTKQRAHKRRRMTYNFKKANFDDFRQLLSKVPWNCCFLSESVNDCWENFKDILFTVADQCIPKSMLKPNLKKSKSWLSEESLSLIRKKRRAFKLARRSGKHQHFLRYRSISNKVRDSTRRDHLLHIEQIIPDLNKDQRSFWRWLKKMRSGQGSNIPDIHHHGKSLTRPIQKAKAFCKFFSSVFVQENEATLSMLKDELANSRSHDELTEINVT